MPLDAPVTMARGRVLQGVLEAMTALLNVRVVECAQPMSETKTRRTSCEFRILAERGCDLSSSCRRINWSARMNPIESEVISIVAATLRLERSSITRDASLEDDLGADSLDWVSLIMALEDRFAVDIPDEDAAELRTVKQVTDYVTLALDAHVSLHRRTAA
jgi:acyl carrier protein